MRNLFLLGFWLAASAQVTAQEPARRMAITFDDLPTVNAVASDEVTRRSMTLDLLRAFGERSIPVTGFVNESQLFVDGRKLESRVDLLRLWLAAGFDLGNHSYSHPDLHRVPLAEFQEDVLRGEIVTRELLAELIRKPEFFRHPYLHTGTDLQTKQALEEFLASHGYRVAPVSIDNSEWIFARAYMLVARAGDMELAEQIGEEYVAYMLKMVEYYEDQSDAFFSRNISHVLLLHANALNAAYFGALADRLADAGYEFITLDEALKDSAYESPDTFTGPGGITWIHRWAITQEVNRSMFLGEPETPEYILNLTELPEHSY